MKRLAMLCLLACTGMGGYVVYVWYMQQKDTSVLLHKVQRQLSEHQAALSQPTTTPASQAASAPTDWARVNASVRNAVAQILVYKTEFNWTEPYKTPRQFTTAGSGFFIDKEGTLVTNAHVVDQARVVYIQIPHFGKRRFDVEVVGISHDRDLALLRVIPEDLQAITQELGSLPVLTIGDSNRVGRTEEIMALGFPLGQDALKSTVGVVSGFQHITNRTAIQIDAAINPGSSGGPSLNKYGEVIGVNYSGIFQNNTQNTGYVIPGNEVNLFLRQLEATSNEDTEGITLLRRPFIGIIFHEASDAVAAYTGNPRGNGCYVQAVYPESPVARAGVKAGDVLYQIDGYTIDYFGEIQTAWSEDRVSLFDYLGRLMPDDPIHLVVYRNGERKEFVVHLEFTQGPPVRSRYPGYEDVDYCVCGGMVMMDLSLNHLPIFAEKNTRLAGFLHHENQMEGRVLVTHVMADSAASRARLVAPGMLLEKVNGERVTNVEEVRHALRKSLDSGYITLTTAAGIFTALPFDDVMREEARLAEAYAYRITPFVRELHTQWKTKNA